MQTKKEIKKATKSKTKKSKDLSILKKDDNLKNDIMKFITSLENISRMSKIDYEKYKLTLNQKIKYENSFIIEYTPNMNPNLDYSYLIQLLKKYGLKQSHNPKDNHVFGIISPSFYNTKFYILNNFQFVRVISDKYSLYFHLQLFFPDHYKKCYPQSFLLSLDTNYSDIKDKIYIARPISAWSGKDIVIIDSYNKLNDVKILLQKTQYTSGISLTEYVSNLVKYKGHKMHLRAYYCITLINNEFNSYLLDTGGLYIAKEKYINGEWNNKDIHDTHFGNTGLYLFFPEDLYTHTEPKLTKDNWITIYNNMKNNLYYISQIALSNIYKYTNSQNAFEVFGCDFFIKDDLSTFLIEINSKNVGYKGFESINKKYFDWINEIVIKPILFPYMENEKNKTPSTTSIFSKTILDY